MPKKPRIIFLDSSTMDTGDLDFTELSSLGDLTLHSTSTPEDATGRINNADIIITNKVIINSQILSQTKNLKLIVVCATGVNNVDLESAKANNVVVSNVVNYSTSIVAQHTLSLLLNLSGNTHRFLSETKLWPHSPTFTRLAHPVTELSGKMLGIAGAGNIGCLVGEIAERMGMKIQILARPGSLTAQHPEWPRVNHELFFPDSDVISLHCPLTEDNHHMINLNSLRKMKTSAFLVNTSRGGLVNEAALGQALRSRSIAGAALDVLSNEPPPVDHLLLESDIPNLLISPHIAWISLEARKRLLQGIIENIQTFLDGIPANRVI